MSPTLRPLRGYEPTGQLTDAELLAAGLETFQPPERWASLRPVTEPQVTVQPDGLNETPFKQMLTKVLEVLDGRRQIGQLRTLLASPVYEATLTRLRVTPPTGLRYRLQSVHSCHLPPNTIELCGRVETTRRGSSHRRSQALAARLERRRDTWQCVFLRIL
jgi:Family of unknown function (DUF6459)